MANAIILFENFFDTATPTGGSYESELPITNLQDDDLGMVARTTTATNAATKILIDFGRERRIDAICLGVPNISPGARYRIRSFAESGRTTTLYDSGIKTLPGVVVDSLTLEWEDPGFWAGINTEELLVEFSTWLIEVVPDEQASNANARWWTIEIFDVDNADGYLDLSRLLAGRAFKPLINFSEDNSAGLESIADVSESLGGHREYWERGLRRTLRLALPWLSQDEIFNDVFRMMVKARTSRQVFVIPDYDDTQFLQQRSFLATFKQVPAIQQLLVERGSTLIDLEEVI